jgi:hypothetical protein
MSAWGETRGELGSEPSALGERDPIAVFRTDGIMEGWIPKLEGRISDGLNDADRMRLRTPAADGMPGDWVELNLDDVMAVAAAPRPPSPARIARRHHPVEIDVGPYHVSGIAHLPLGADPARYVSSTGRRWLPLTACTVASGEDTWAVEVVVVNLDHASRRTAVYEAPHFG